MITNGIFFDDVVLTCLPTAFTGPNCAGPTSELRRTRFTPGKLISVNRPFFNAVHAVLPGLQLLVSGCSLAPKRILR